MNRLNWNVLAELMLRRPRTFIAGFCLLCGLFLLAISYRSYVRAQTRLEMESTELQLAQSKLDGIASSSTELRPWAEIERLQRELREKTPIPADSQKITQHITNISQRNDVSLSEVVVSSTRRAEGFQLRTLKFRAVGHPGNLYRFLTDLNRFDPLLEILETAFSVQVDEDAEVVIVLRSFERFPA